MIHKRVLDERAPALNHIKWLRAKDPFGKVYYAEFVIQVYFNAKRKDMHYALLFNLNLI